MRFTPTKVSGVAIVDLEPIVDDRGSFIRTWDVGEAKKSGYPLDIAQTSISTNKRSHTLRGMHYQVPPHAEIKLVRCTKGAIFDVALDLRIDSPTYKEWVAVELSAENQTALYIPAGCAHGFQTLTDDAEVLYYMSADYVEDAARGVRYDDPAFGIAWPHTPRMISKKDSAYPDWSA